MATKRCCCCSTCATQSHAHCLTLVRTKQTQQGEPGASSAYKVHNHLFHAVPCRRADVAPCDKHTCWVLLTQPADDCRCCKANSTQNCLHLQLVPRVLLHHHVIVQLVLSVPVYGSNMMQQHGFSCLSVSAGGAAAPLQCRDKHEHESTPWLLLHACKATAQPESLSLLQSRRQPLHADAMPAVPQEALHAMHPTLVP